MPDRHLAGATSVRAGYRLFIHRCASHIHLFDEALSGSRWVWRGRQPNLLQQWIVSFSHQWALAPLLVSSAFCSSPSSMPESVGDDTSPGSQLDQCLLGLQSSKRTNELAVSSATSLPHTRIGASRGQPHRQDDHESTFDSLSLFYFLCEWNILGFSKPLASHKT